MSDVSSRSRELFEAAKADGPSESSRDLMWAGIQLAAVPLAPKAGAGTHLAVKAIASSKLALGVALGASITVGVAGAVLVLARPTAPSITHVAEPRGLERGGRATSADDPPTVDRSAVIRLPPTPVVVTGHAVASAPTDTVELDPVVPQQRTSTHTVAAVSERDRLAQEARMVSEARGALLRGEPETALRIVRAAKSQHGARLVPEELTVEAQALRAMGDEAGAARAEAELAGKFPEQDLAQ
jgi:hypothetical protein